MTIMSSVHVTELADRLEDCPMSLPTHIFLCSLLADHVEDCPLIVQ